MGDRGYLSQSHSYANCAQLEITDCLSCVCPEVSQVIAAADFVWSGEDVQSCVR